MVARSVPTDVRNLHKRCRCLTICQFVHTSLFSQVRLRSDNSSTETLQTLYFKYIAKTLSQPYRTILEFVLLSLTKPPTIILPDDDMPLLYYICVFLLGDKTITIYMQIGALAISLHNQFTEGCVSSPKKAKNKR